MAKRPSQYDVLLRIRQLQEDLDGQILAEAQRAVGAAERERAALAEERFQLLSEASGRGRRRIDPGVVRSYFQYERHVAHLLNAKDAELTGLRATAEERRTELENSMKRRRIVEKLREHKFQAFMDEVRRDEQKFSDEAATNRAAIPRIQARKVTGKESGIS